MGASLVEGGIHAVNWGGFDGWHPVGVFGTLVALAVSVPLGALAALLLIRALRLARATRHAALARTGPRGRVGNVGRARVQPRRQRRPEVGRRDRRASARGRADRHVGCSHMDEAPVRGGAHRRHRTGRVADHSHRGPPHLPHQADRGAGQPDRLGQRHLRGLARRARRYPRPRWSPPRSSGSARGEGAGTTCTGRWCAQMGLAWLITMPVTAALAAAALGIWRLVA